MKSLAASFAAWNLPTSHVIEVERSMMSITSSGSLSSVGSPAPVTVRVTVVSVQVGSGDTLLSTSRWGGVKSSQLGPVTIPVSVNCPALVNQATSVDSQMPSRVKQNSALPPGARPSSHLMRLPWAPLSHVGSLN